MKERRKTITKRQQILEERLKSQGVAVKHAEELGIYDDILNTHLSQLEIRLQRQRSFDRSPMGSLLNPFLNRFQR